MDRMREVAGAGLVVVVVVVVVVVMVGGAVPCWLLACATGVPGVALRRECAVVYLRRKHQILSCTAV